MVKSRFKISQNGFSKVQTHFKISWDRPTWWKTASGFLEMGLQGCDGGSSFLEEGKRPGKKSYGIICLIIQKHDLCGRIENNVEAFRYYLALKSGQFHSVKIMGKWLLRLCLLYIYPQTDSTYTSIERGIIVLLLTDGQSRASMQW